MGRHKGYDRVRVLDKALALFHRQGFSATSTQQLVEYLGINRNSLYSEFGTKQQLFEAALTRYDETVVAQNFGPLEVSDGGAAEIRSLFKLFAADASGPGRGVGCILCNAAVERAPLDAGSAKLVERYIKRICRAFGNALSNSGLRPGVDMLAEANFFTASVLGIAVMVRANASPAQVRSACRAAIEHLEMLLTSTPRPPSTPPRRSALAP